MTCCWSSGHRYGRQTPPQNNPLTWSILLCAITLIAAPPFPPHLQGATKYGTISKSRFNSILTTTFGPEKGFFWTDAKLNLLNAHYGTGSKDLNLGATSLWRGWTCAKTSARPMRASRTMRTRTAR